MPNKTLKRNSFSRRIWQLLFILNTALILGYWWQGSGSTLLAGGYEFLIAIGRLAGLSAAWAVLLQFVFMGRTPWLERVFGLDKLARIHHVSGKWGFLLLALHPFLLTVGYAGLSDTSLSAQFLTFFRDYQYVWLAVIGLILFVLVVGMSLTIVRSKLRYESWYFVHLLVYGAMGTSFWHQIAVGPDLLASQLFYWYWISLYAVVLSAHIVFRFARPLYLAHKHQFKVDRIVRENYNTVSVYISARRLAEFDIHPGQFMILRFLDKKRWWQAHPFSLSRLPPAISAGRDGQQLRITVKELGDFTRGVGELQTGTTILIDGPYGVFTEWVSVSPKALFIAGGIGITPVRSLMEQMLAAGKSVMLLYANKTKADIVFGQELGLLEERYNGTVVDVLSDELAWTGEKGFIDAEKIQRLVPDVIERDVYVCGPPPMMAAVLTVLEKIGVPTGQIHYEKFEL